MKTKESHIDFLTEELDRLSSFQKGKAPGIASDFAQWKKSRDKELKKIKDYKTKEVIRQINKMNKPHKGSELFHNSKDKIVELKGVSKWFANARDGTFIKVLSDVNLSIDRGQVVMILGESGSGKSTLLNIISGICRASNGHTVVANHNLISMSKAKLTKFRRRYVSFVFQNYSLNSQFTVQENIEFGQELQRDVRKRLDVDELIDALNIREQVDKYPKFLSGGQQQRVAIVKAVSKNPEILFGDEPTGAVDESTANEILKIFCEMNKKYNLTVFIVTHNPLITVIADVVIRINKGKIISCKGQTPKSVDEIKWIN